MFLGLLFINIHAEEKVGRDYFFERGHLTLSSLQLSLMNDAFEDQDVDRESVVFLDQAKSSNKMKSCWSQCRVVRSTAVPSLFFLASGLSWSYREAYRETRNRYVNDFDNHYDDVLQHVPTLGVIGLNAVGVKGRHTLPRACMNMVYSNLVMAAFVNLLKNNVAVLRPDGSSYNSFPSGHTATAFVGATAMHKEYGTYRDPMYSLFAYSAAIGTGVGRQLNNRHWISDVLAGAGIGILSTEIGYWLGEKIHGNWGVNDPLEKNGFLSKNYRPSFLEIKLGFSNSLETEVDGVDAEMQQGFLSGIEGAWFFHRNFGIGGQMMLSNFPFKEKGLESVSDQFENISEGVHTQALGIKYVGIGPYVDFPLSQKWAIGGNLNLGYAKGFKGKHLVDVLPEYQKVLGSQLTVAEFDPGSSWILAYGASLRRIISKTVSAKLFIDSGYTSCDWQVRRVTSVDTATGNITWGPEKVEGSVRTFYVAYGVAISAIIW